MRMLTRRVALATALALLTCGARPARAQDPVVTWMDLADWVEGRAAEADRAYRTAATTRAQAQVALAVFEARNAVERRYAPYLGGVDAPPGASADAAVAAAAHAVLSALFPGQRQAADDALTVALAAVPDGAAETGGVEVGKRAAEAVMRRAALPAGAALAAYRPRTAPGAYIDPGLPSILPFDLAMPPWFLRSASELRPQGPPALTGERYARDLDEVRRLGAKASAERTAAQTLLAPALLYVDYASLLRDVARRPGRSPLQNARMYALALMAGDDGWLAVMEAKMHFGTWRPITALRNADEDGNDRTTAVPDWEPLLRTPTHPDYPCGHCVYAAAVGTVLEAETGPAPDGGIHVRSTEHHPGLVATVPTWKAFVDAMSLSRIHAGAHTRFANEDAEAIGRAVARRALAGAMRPLAAAR
jgi:hypothetical protein